MFQVPSQSKMIWRLHYTEIKMRALNQNLEKWSLLKLANDR